jgi:hypothetical protein
LQVKYLDLFAVVFKAIVLPRIPYFLGGDIALPEYWRRMLDMPILTMK